MANSTPDPQFAWMHRFAEELVVLRPNINRGSLLVEAQRAYDSMGAGLLPEEAAHLWMAEGDAGSYEQLE